MFSGDKINATAPEKSKSESSIIMEDKFHIYESSSSDSSIIIKDESLNVETKNGYTSEFY